MKKILALILAMTLLFALVSCGEDDDVKDTSPVIEEEVAESDEIKIPSTENEEYYIEEDIDAEEEVEEEPEEDVEEEIEQKNESVTDLFIRVFIANVLGDADTVYPHLVNPYMVEYEIAEGGYADEAAVKESFYELIKLRKEGNIESFGKNLSVSVKILNYKNYSSSEVSKIAKASAEQTGIPEESLEALCVINYSATITGDDDSQTSTDDMVLSKLDGQWYLGLYGSTANGYMSAAEIDAFLN